MIVLIDSDIVSIIGHTWLGKQGYFFMSVGKGEQEYVHRKVVEHTLGRKLSGTEIVHHVNENKADCQRTNLVVCPDDSYHQLLHARARIYDLGGHPVSKYAYCSYHQDIHLKTEFTSNPSKWDGVANVCREGMREYRKTTGKSQSPFNWRSRLMQQYRRAKAEVICWF